jgi:CHAD domain-containing protein
VAETETVDPLREELAAQATELQAHEPGVRAGEVEALHRFRVATRRSRALLRPHGGVDELQRELRWLADLLGPVRDLDVLIEHLRARVEELDDDRADGEVIVSALEARRAQARDALLAGLDSERYPALLARFRTEVATLAPNDVDRLRALAAREYRRLARARDELGLEAASEDLHRLRIKAKRTRYAAELAAGAGAKKLAQLADAAKRVQDTIGVHQDAVVAEQQLRQVSTPKSRIAAGRIVEHERERRRDARAKLPKLWKRLDRAAGRAF